MANVEALLQKSIDTLQLDTVRDQLGSLKEKGSEPERLKAVIERILRTKAVSYGNSDIHMTEINNFVEFVISLAKEEMCAKTLTIQILQDIFDVSTTARCEEFFEFVEAHIDTWKTPFFFDSCKNMILRMCNDLLKRLSRTIDTTFCGRILILLAKSLPLNEKSGLNLTGQFNTQNVTVFDQEKKELFDDVQQQHEPGPTEDDMEIGEIRENKDTAGPIPTDHNLYIKFWRLQKMFSNPNSLFDVEKFKQFESDISDVLSIFSSYKLEKPQRQQEQSPSRTREPTESNCVNVDGVNKKTDEMNGNAERMEVEQLNGYKVKKDVNDEASAGSPTSALTKKSLLTSERTFFAKYLTSQKLFPLQLSDSQFRRYFLLQCLIVTNYLASRAKLKEPIELTAAQESGLRELTDKCFVLLRETYPHGSHFADSVKKILAREKQWSNWKGEGCPDLVGQLATSQERKCAVFKRKPINRYDPTTLDLGNREMTRLWNIEKKNLQACRSTHRKCIPELKSFLEEALDEMDPDQQVEEQFQSVNDEKYQWMANRFLLFTSDQYINLAVQEANARTPDRPEKVANTKMNGTILRKAIQLTAENMPELKPRVDSILERIEQKLKKEVAARQAEEARLATKTKELEKRIREEEEKEAAAETFANKKPEREEASNGVAVANAVVKEERMDEYNHHHQQQQNSHAPTSRKGTGERSERSERQRPLPAETSEKEEMPPKKRIKQEEETASNGSHSSRRREKEEPTPEHEQHRDRSGASRKGEEKERKGTGGGGGGEEGLAGDKDRKSRKRHVEKSEERKGTATGNSSSSGTGTSAKGAEKERKGGSGSAGTGRASSDREREHRAADNDRAKKRK